MNVKLIIEYDGSNFFGWQRQVGLRTVQEELSKAIEVYFISEVKKNQIDPSLIDSDRKPIEVIGSSRTDSGVHARGQVAHFSWPDVVPFNSRKLLKSINAITNEDVAIKSIEIVSDDFHSRGSNISKTYHYRLLHREAPPILMLGKVWHIRKFKNLPLMLESANLFMGEHDFKSFRASDCGSRITIRKIYNSQFYWETDEILVFSINGNGFLKHQVRFIVGSLVSLGHGKLSKDTLLKMISGEPRVNFELAPAHGLTLEEVFY